MSKGIKEISKTIKRLLESELPGKTSHLKMIPETRRSFKNNVRDKQAAVMLLLFQENDEIKLSFIKRNEYKGVHSGQISFPGGMRENADRDLLHTSLRETSEETGINEKDINVLGKISTLYIPVSNFVVQPYVAYLDFSPTFDPDPVEVKFMIKVPLKHLLNKDNRKKEQWNLSGDEVRVPFFFYKDFKIWGATAMMLSEFLDIIQDIEPDL